MHTTPTLPLKRRDFLKHASISGASLLTAVGSEAALASGAAVPVKTEGVTPAVPLAPPEKQPPDLVLPTVVKKKIGWAVAGLGELALGEILPAFGSCRYSVLKGLISGHPDKARRIAEVYHVPQEGLFDYKSFDRMIENPEIDVVYIVLPNSLHAEFTIRALRAGKHVLCEKPMAATTAECRQMLDVAKETGKKLMVAYRLHYEPLNRKVMELCKAKALGKIKLFSSSNCQNVKAPNIRLSGELAGGPVGDVGIYSLNAARYVTGEEPVEVSAWEHRPADDPRFVEVPESVTTLLRYPSGVLAQCMCSFGTAGIQRYDVVCDEGVITMDPAFPYRGLRLKVSRTKGPSEEPEIAELRIPQINHFAAEMDHFSECVGADHTPRTPGEMGLADMLIVEAIAESVRTGLPVKL